MPLLPGTETASLALAQPEDKILLIYNHGSQAENKRDYCYPNSWTTPTVIKRLSGEILAGLEVVVYGFCSPWRLGGYSHLLRLGEPKVLKRAKSLEALVQQFQQQGVPARQIFLVGHSAGGWASLLVLRRGLVEVNSAIAFAPAFAGKKADRSEGWQYLRQQQINYLSEVNDMPSLIYAFEGDAFNAPADLLFLNKIPGVTFVQENNRFGMRECGALAGHRAVFTSCFANARGEQVRAFIVSQLIRE